MAMDGKVKCCRWGGAGREKEKNRKTNTETLPRIPSWFHYMEVWESSEPREVKYSSGNIYEPENECWRADFSVIPKEAFVLFGAKQIFPLPVSCLL